MILIQILSSNHIRVHLIANDFYLSILGWIAKIKLNNPDELKSLLNKEDYDKFVEEEEA